MPRRFVDPMLAANRSVALATVHRRHPDARPVDPDPAADPMPGRPGLCYLIRHGTRLHSIPSFTAWRIALAAGLAGALTEGLGLGHPYWAILTAAIVLHLWIGRIATTLRAIHRAVGTVLGLCVVYAVGMTDPTPWVLVWAVVVSIVAMTMLLPFGYALAMIFVTPMSLLSIDAATGGPVMDLNAMVQRGHFAAEMIALSGGETLESDGDTLVIVALAPLTLSHQGKTVALERLDAFAASAGPIGVAGEKLTAVLHRGGECQRLAATARA